VICRHAALGDLDGDGDLDLVMIVDDYRSNRVPSPLQILLWENDGKGHFGPSKRLSIPADPILGDWSTEVVLVDMDGDGDLDIVAGFARFFWNNGIGQFASRDAIPTRAGVFQPRMIAADVNRDGRMDILLAGSTVSGEVWTQDAQGGFQLYGLTYGHNAGSVALADANGDGLLDVWLDDRTTSGHYVYLYFNMGSGLDSGRTVHSGAGFNLGDLDLDGDIDILSNVLLRNDGNGAFTADPGAIASWSGPPFGLASKLVDIDGDGDLDFPLIVNVDTQKGIYTAAILRNHTRHLALPPQTRLGSNLAVELYSRPGRSLVLGISPREFRGTMGLWGDLRLDPSAMVLLPVRPAGTTTPLTWNFAVPNDPLLLGFDLRMQALDIGPMFSGEAHFTGLRRTSLVQ
jgi:hypothetical protein